MGIEVSLRPLQVKVYVYAWFGFRMDLGQVIGPWCGVPEQAEFSVPSINHGFVMGMSESGRQDIPSRRVAEITSSMLTDYERGLLARAGKIGKVEIPWQAGVFVFAEDDGVVQVRHGVEDQREDVIRLTEWEATELAYFLLWAVNQGTWTVSSHKDLLRLRIRFREIVEIGCQEMRVALNRMDQAFRNLRQGSSAEDGRKGLESES